MPFLIVFTRRLHCLENVSFISKVSPPRRRTELLKLPLTLRRLMSYIYGTPILDISRSHTTTQHSRWDSSGRVISSSQRPLPDNTRHSQQTNIHAPGGIQTSDLSRSAAAGRSPAETVGSNPTGGMDICLL